MTALDRDVAVHVLPAPPRRSADIEREVDAIWAQACRDRPSLFNGRIFSADVVAAGRITGHWSEYRYALAQLGEPGLARTVGVHPLAVNGLVRCVDGYVLGRRQPAAVYYPGCWQAAPAGNVEARDGRDDVSLQSQLFAELEEELGVASRDVVDAVAVVAMEHPHTGIIDIGFLATTGLRYREIRRRWRMGGNDEYDRLRLIGFGTVGEFIERAGRRLLPTASILLRC